GVIDEIVPEPIGGAHREPTAAIKATGEAVGRALEELKSLDRETVRKLRRGEILAVGRTTGCGTPLFNCQKTPQACPIGPGLCLRALGSARLPLFCLPPNARGGALSTHALDFARAARVLPGGLAQEAWYILARIHQRSLSAPRGNRRLIAFYGCWT